MSENDTMRSEWKRTIDSFGYLGSKEDIVIDSHDARMRTLKNLEKKQEQVDSEYQIALKKLNDEFNSDSLKIKNYESMTKIVLDQREKYKSEKTKVEPKDLEDLKKLVQLEISEISPMKGKKSYFKFVTYTEPGKPNTYGLVRLGFANTLEIEKIKNEYDKYYAITKDGKVFYDKNGYIGSINCDQPIKDIFIGWVSGVLTKNGTAYYSRDQLYDHEDVTTKHKLSNVVAFVSDGTYIQNNHLGVLHPWELTKIKEGQLIYLRSKYQPITVVKETRIAYIGNSQLEIPSHLDINNLEFGIFARTTFLKISGRKWIAINPNEYIELIDEKLNIVYVDKSYDLLNHGKKIEISIPAKGFNSIKAVEYGPVLEKIEH